MEKAIKAFFISIDEKFSPIHSIGKLLGLLHEKGIEIPPEIQEASILNEYAVKTRYPGDTNPVTKKTICKL